MPAPPRLGMFGNLGMPPFPQVQEMYSSYLSSLDRPSPTDQSLLGLGLLALDPDDLGHREIVAWRNLTGDAYARTAVDRYGTVLHRHLHGKREPGGWQVDHYPIAKCEGGPDIEWNWQALGYKANELEGAAMSALLRRGLLW
jgi:hypothetical protein